MSWVTPSRVNWAVCAVIVPDVNLLVHAMDASSDHHAKAWDWWSATLVGAEHVGFTWPVLMGYVRLTTHPRIMIAPQRVESALDDVNAWLELPAVRILLPGPEHVHIMRRLASAAGAYGNLVPDAHLAAMALENGGTVYSQDADFARFPEVRWVNPLV